MLVCWESPKKPLTLFFQPVQPPLLLIIITMSNPPIIPTPPIIRDSRVQTLAVKLQVVKVSKDSMQNLIS